VLWTERIDPRLVLVRLEALDGNLHALLAPSLLRDAAEAFYLFDVHGHSDSDVGDGTESAVVQTLRLLGWSSSQRYEGVLFALCECTRRNPFTLRVRRSCRVLRRQIRGPPKNHTTSPYETPPQNVRFFLKLSLKAMILPPRIFQLNCHCNSEESAGLPKKVLGILEDTFNGPISRQSLQSSF